MSICCYEWHEGSLVCVVARDRTLTSASIKLAGGGTGREPKRLASPSPLSAERLFAPTPVTTNLIKENCNFHGRTKGHWRYPNVNHSLRTDRKILRELAPQGEQETTPNFARTTYHMAGVQVAAPVSYLATVPEEEKPYHMMYGDFEGLPRTNISREWHETTFEDVRGSLSELPFERTGFTVRNLPSKMAYEDFDDDSKVWAVYFKELEVHLQEYLGAKIVKFFRYGIRKRHPEFPVSTGHEYEFAQPTSIAHVDATLDSTREEMTRQFGDRAPDLMSRRFQWINVWRPLRGPTNDWPLCFCDASTLGPGDAHATDMVYPDYFTENLSLRFSADQRWYFLSDHAADEIIIFKQSDSDAAAVGGVPHCSFANPAASKTELPRESIEARALVVY